MTLAAITFSAQEVVFALPAGAFFGWVLAPAGARHAYWRGLRGWWALVPLAAGIGLAELRGFALAALVVFAVRGGSRLVDLRSRPIRRPGPSVTERDYVIGATRDGYDFRARFGLDRGIHSLVLGATGSGKTTALTQMASAHIARGLGVIGVDLKADAALAAQLKLHAVRAGRPYYNWTLRGGDHWNPLARGDASELKDKLLSLELFTEPHYKRMYERYLLTVFRVLEHAGTRVTLRDLVPLLRPDELAAYLRTLPDDDFTREVSAYLQDLSRDQAKHLFGLRDRIALLAEGTQGPYLEPGRPLGTIDLLEAVSAGAVVVFSLDAASYPEPARLVANLVVQDLICVCGTLEREPWRKRPALFTLDEFSALDSGLLAGLFQRARSALISVACITQELADLRRIAPGFDEQLQGNVELTLSGRQNNPQSAELIARLAGTEMVVERTVQTREKGLIFPHTVGTGLGSARWVHQFVIDPDTIKQLGVGEMVAIAKNPHRVAVIDTIPTAVGPPEREDANQRGPRYGHLPAGNAVPPPSLPQGEVTQPEAIAER